MGARESRYRKNALKMMSELVRRAPKGSEVKMYKEDRGKALAWPGDLGKHHALIEEMIKLICAYERVDL